jgi:hypothetical protein
MDVQGAHGHRGPGAVRQLTLILAPGRSRWGTLGRQAFPMEWVTAIFLGFSIGLIELLSRYWNEPINIVMAVVLSWVHLFINALAAFVVCVIFLNAVFPDVSEIERYLLAVVSGLAGPILLRARLLSFGRDEDEAPFGPGYAIEQILRLIDEEVEQRNGVRRVKLIKDVMYGKDFVLSRERATVMILGSRHKISLMEQKQLANEIREISDRKVSEQDKAYALGFVLLDFMGERFLRTVADSLPEAGAIAVKPGQKDRSHALAASSVQPTSSGIDRAVEVVADQTVTLLVDAEDIHAPGIGRFLAALQASFEAETGATLEFFLPTATSRPTASTHTNNVG